MNNKPIKLTYEINKRHVDFEWKDGGVLVTAHQENGFDEPDKFYVILEHPLGPQAAEIATMVYGKPVRENSSLTYPITTTLMEFLASV